MIERRIRKDDIVRLKPNIFVHQKTGETARVDFVYLHQIYVTPALNGHRQFSADSLERVVRDVRRTQ